MPDDSQLDHLPRTLILDLDGILTSGSMTYSKKGKIQKLFGPDDHDALIVMRNFMDIQVVTADSKGYLISKRRVNREMQLPLSLVPSDGRLIWISERFDLGTTIYMGDGIFDHRVFAGVMYSITIPTALEHVLLKASFVTQHNGGDRAVAEACIHISNRFFKGCIFPDMVV